MTPHIGVNGLSSITVLCAGQCVATGADWPCISQWQHSSPVTTYWHDLQVSSHATSTLTHDILAHWLILMAPEDIKPYCAHIPVLPLMWFKSKPKLCFSYR